MPLDATGREDSLRQQLLEDWLAFVEIEHENLPYPEFPDNILSLTSDSVSHTCDFGEGSRTYQACPMELALQSSGDDRPPQATIKVMAFDEAIQAVRSLGAEPQCRIFVALAGDLALSPVPIQKRADGYIYTPAYDREIIDLIIRSEDLFDEAQSRYQFTPRNNPSLFGITA